MVGQCGGGSNYPYIDEIRPMEFQYLLSGITPGHRGMAVQAVNVPVSIAGMDVAPGEIIHMDENGARKFPADKLEAVLTNVKALLEEEGDRIGKLLSGPKTAKQVRAIFSGHFYAEDDDTHLAQAYILIKAGADVNAQALSELDDEAIMDNEHFVQYGKETPLHFAARLGNLRMVRLLLDHGANPSLKTVSRIRQPKQFTEWTDDVTSLVWPLREFKRVVFQPYEGETPLDMALREGNKEIVNTLNRRVEVASD